MKHARRPMARLAERRGLPDSMPQQKRIYATAACRRRAQSGRHQLNCPNPQVLHCWICGRRGVRTINRCQQRDVPASLSLVNAPYLQRETPRQRPLQGCTHRQGQINSTRASECPMLIHDPYLVANTPTFRCRKATGPRVLIRPSVNKRQMPRLITRYPRRENNQFCLNSITISREAPQQQQHQRQQQVPPEIGTPKYKYHNNSTTTTTMNSKTRTATTTTITTRPTNRTMPTQQGLYAQQNANDNLNGCSSNGAGSLTSGMPPAIVQNGTAGNVKIVGNESEISYEAEAKQILPHSPILNGMKGDITTSSNQLQQKSSLHNQAIQDNNKVTRSQRSVNQICAHSGQYWHDPYLPG
ncbi:uncharacterized protein ACN427_005554 isoform 1-T2 [Glossina fuscipes fuscipes]